MSNVVVYVFLLDSLPGFRNILNETVIRNIPRSYSNFTPVLKPCDASTTNQILNAVTRELDTEIMPTIKTGDKFALSVNDALNDASQEALYNALLESSLPVVDGKDGFDKAVDSVENDSGRKNRRNFSFDTEDNIKNIIEEEEHSDNVTKFSEEVEHDIGNTNNCTDQDVHKNITNHIDHIEKVEQNLIDENKQNNCDNNVTEEVKNSTSMELDFPKSAPFLVAIFETLSNVTAQTCAGTLIDPNWVLTGANCVNILSNLYANDTNMTDSQTLYTVVAGADDPLSDGSAHNVTAVLQHQGFADNSTRNRKSVHVEIGPFLAMMKIEPAFEVVGLPLVEEKVTKGDVMIYGWILTKNDSGLDTLNLVIISALILSSAECQAMYSFNNNDVICLFNNDKETNITQVSSGGPVLVLHGGEVKLLAVAQTDEHVFIAYPLYVHYNWIKTILNTTAFS